ncbi:hypothetical protein FRC10_001384 [Ceratobasidium sp. 414]|nr:hypothetical protein FRC10_001384 [Ceratobasidium sp. 414]
MEACIETMWRTVLSSENGAHELWEDQRKFTAEAVWRAASAAAEADEKQNGPEKWGEAWDIAWSDSWDKMSKGRSQSSDSVSDLGQEGVSMRAKEAWKDAWDDACEANKKYVPLLSNGVAEYVTKNLPDSLPEVLKIDMSTQSKMHALLATMGSEMNNSRLQEFIHCQIVDSCRRARWTLGIKQTSAEIEEAMRRAWVETIKVLDIDQK